MIRLPFLYFILITLLLLTSCTNTEPTVPLSPEVGESDTAPFLHEDIQDIISIADTPAFPEVAETNEISSLNEDLPNIINEEEKPTLTIDEEHKESPPACTPSTPQTSQKSSNTVLQIHSEITPEDIPEPALSTKDVVWGYREPDDWREVDDEIIIQLIIENFALFDAAKDAFLGKYFSLEMITFDTLTVLYGTIELDNETLALLEKLHNQCHVFWIVTGANGINHKTGELYDYVSFAVAGNIFCKDAAWYSSIFIENRELFVPKSVTGENYTGQWSVVTWDTHFFTDEAPPPDEEMPDIIL